MRICFFGDSFVNGTNDPACQGWVGRIGARARAAGLDVTLYNLGIRRDTSADIAMRWRAEATARLPADQPGLLVFSFGVNDCCEDCPGTPRQTFDASLATARTILAGAAQLRPTLMVGPPPIAAEAVNSRISRLSGGLSRLCRDLGVPYLDVFTPLAAHPRWRHEVEHGDGAHPAAGGYEALAALVAEWPYWQAALRCGAT